MFFSSHNRTQFVALCFNDARSLISHPATPQRLSLRWAHPQYWFGPPPSEPRAASARAVAQEPELRRPVTSNLSRREFLEQDQNGHLLEGGSSRQPQWDFPAGPRGARVNPVWRGGCGTTLSLCRSE